MTNNGFSSSKASCVLAQKKIFFTPNLANGLALAVALQGPLLAYMSLSSHSGWFLLCGLSLGLSLLAKKAWASPLTDGAAHRALMLSFGSAGMLLGWLGDFGWLPLLREGVCLCGCIDSALGDGCRFCFWMYAGMYMGCIPCFFIQSFKGNCKKIPLFLSLIGMGLGMFLGSTVVGLLPIDYPMLQFFLTFIAMILGMLIGMSLFHAIGRKVFDQSSIKRNYKATA